jgi:hypothetical protein
MARVDLDAAGQKVRDWLLAYPSGTPEQMADDLKGEYGEHAEAMAIVLRGIMARYTNNPEELADLQARSAGPAGSSATLRLFNGCAPAPLARQGKETSFSRSRLSGTFRPNDQRDPFTEVQPEHKTPVSEVTRTRGV